MILNIGGKEVDIYDSIDYLPIVRFQQFNKLVIIESGIGGSINDFDTHLGRIMQYIEADRKDEANQEILNLRQNLQFILEGVNPSFLAFIYLIKRIDSKVYDVIDDNAIREISTLMGNATMNDFTTPLEVVKKKIDSELMLYFPDLFNGSKDRVYYDLLRQRTYSMLEAIEVGDSENHQPRIKELTQLLIDLTKPLSFSGSGGFEVKSDKDFESLCVILSQEMNVSPKRFTVKEYYIAVELLNKQQKDGGKSNKI